MGATNRPQDIDTAILQRMPTRFQISQPSSAQRQAIINLVLENEYVDEDVDLPEVAYYADGFSGSDLKEMCRDAALFALQEYEDSSSDDGFSEDSVKIHQRHLIRAAESICMFQEEMSQGTGTQF